MEFPAKPRRNTWVGALLLGVALLGTAVGIYPLLAPTSLGYAVEPDALVVDAHLGFWDQGARFPRGSLGRAEAVRLHGARRTAGTGLPGYCTGRWSFAETGAAWVATSCVPDAVQIAGPDGTIVITPADRDAFLAALATPGSSGRFDAAPAPTERGGFATVIAVVLGAVFLSLVLLARAVTRPMVYRVEDGELIVPANLGKVRVRLLGATATRGPLVGALRIGGTALPGFYLGLFRAKGRNLHVAATDLRDGVRVEGDRVVYMSPLDPEAFVAAIRAVAGR